MVIFSVSQAQHFKNSDGHFPSDRWWESPRTATSSKSCSQHQGIRIRSLCPPKRDENMGHLSDNWKNQSPAFPLDLILWFHRLKQKHSLGHLVDAIHLNRDNRVIGDVVLSKIIRNAKIPGYDAALHDLMSTQNSLLVGGDAFGLRCCVAMSCGTHRGETGAQNIKLLTHVDTVDMLGSWGQRQMVGSLDTTNIGGGPWWRPICCGVEGIIVQKYAHPTEDSCILRTVGLFCTFLCFPIYDIFEVYLGSKSCSPRLLTCNMIPYDHMIQCV